MALDNLKKERTKKLNNLKRLGINPYPSKFDRKHTTAQAKKLMGKKVSVAGRIRSLRPHGKITFGDLEDASGKIQLLFSTHLKGEKYELLPNLDIGDFIGVEGEVIKTKAGETTVDAADFTLLSKSIRPLPSAWYGLEDVEERYRQRYVDLVINPQVKEVILTRTKIINFLRDFLSQKGFIEIETPILQPIYGGAAARPFTTHHKTLDIRLYLRISDELYLKRLIVGGFEKVFEVGKDFRNEGIDRQHNPEFTQLEFYWAYADYEDLMRLTEELVSQTVKEIMGKFKFTYEDNVVDFKPPIKRASFFDLIKQHTGISLHEIKSEKELLEKIKKSEFKLDLKGVVGFGPMADALYKEAVRPKIIQPTFVTDYPSDMLPLAKAKEGDRQKAGSFQLLCMGFELVKAYNELNDPQEQEKRWKEQMGLAKRGLEDHQVLDTDYIRALEYGMPPTAGWGMGIDRFTALLTNQHSLKDVILFPTLKPERKSSK